MITSQDISELLIYMKTAPLTDEEIADQRDLYGITANLDYKLDEYLFKREKRASNVSLLEQRRIEIGNALEKIKNKRF